MSVGCQRFILSLVLVATGAWAQVPATCDQQHEVDKYQLFRRLSLDLRGRVPSYEEYLSLDSQPTVPASTIRAWISSSDFKQVMRRYHENLFWPNVSNVSLNNVNAALTMKTTTTPPEVANSIASSGRRKLFRGDPDVNTTYGQTCGDFAAVTSGAPNFTPTPASLKQTTLPNGTVVYQEGWRLVEPYWAPGTTIKVCAFDAQETESVVLNGKTYLCNDPATQSPDALYGSANNVIKRACGCGKNLKFCYGPSLNVAKVILANLREQMLLKVDEVTTGGRPYTELLTTTTAKINGPIAFWKKYLAPNSSITRVYGMADPNEVIPDFHPPGNTADTWFADTTFRDYDRKDSTRATQLHAGVLTLPAYLLRFQTNRGRANRFKIDFQCAPFEPPSALESGPGCQTEGTDLMQRCTCRYCHKILEPLAAHWGQFTEAGSLAMTDLSLFPRSNPACVPAPGKAPSSFCDRFYVTNPDGDHPGSLLPYQYAVKDGVHDAIATSIAAGPRESVNAIIASGEFADCTVRRVFAQFAKRDMRTLGAQQEDVDLLNKLKADFKASGYSLPALIEEVVNLPQYRSVR